MPSVTIPLVGTFTGQTIPNAKFSDGGTFFKTGQQFINCVFNQAVNPATNTQTIYIEKRPGLRLVTDWGSTTDSFTAIIAPAFNESTYVAAYGATNSTIVGAVSTTNTYAPSGLKSGGTITGVCRAFSETIYDTVGYVAMVSSDGTGWYYPMDAGSGTPTFTADTTSGSATLSNVSSFSGLYVGQALSGTGIPATARIQSMNSGAGTLVMGSDSATTTNATANGTGVTITRTPIAKIIDTDFPSAVGRFVFVDGYAFVMTASGRVYNSALNSITSWGASDYATANLSTDVGVTLARYKNQIMAFGTEACELLYNAGNPSGSVLNRSDQNFFRVGCAGAQAIVNVEDTIYFIGTSSSRGAAVYKMEGFSPVEISSPYVIAIFQQLAAGTLQPTNLTLGASRIGGNVNLFMVSEVTPGVTEALLYDTKLGLWHLWQSSDDECLLTFPAFLGDYGRIFFAGDNGKIFEARFGDITYYRDDTTDGTDGESYIMDIITRKINFGSNNRTFLKRVQLNCDKKTTGAVDFYTSDDETSQSFTLRGSFDLTDSAPDIYRCGSFVGGRIFRFYHDDAEACRIESVTFDYDKGVH